MSRRQLIAGNWKMNGLRAQMPELTAIGDAFDDGRLAGCEALLCPPFTILAMARTLLPDGIAVGGQDCHDRESGSFTGDISGAMLADAGASHVILGHSERRTTHGEDDALVRRKCEAAWGAGLTAIVCIGETEEERDGGRTLDVLGRQLAGSLPDGTTGDNAVIAYEPVWAIGTGRTPRAAEVRDVHEFLREALSARFGSGEAGGMRILYGGSVKPANAGEMLRIPNVDGALVGGASLRAADFIAICAAAKTN